MSGNSLNSLVIHKNIENTTVIIKQPLDMVGNFENSNTEDGKKVAVKFLKTLKNC